MKKQYINPETSVLELDNTLLIADSHKLEYGGGPGSGNVGAKEDAWEWDEDEEW